jgi:cytosine/adenosine deaminase-related metal-dependent hydrolase
LSIHTLAARYVFPVTGDPVADGMVVVDGGRIVAVGRVPQYGYLEDLGNVALLPGLINAHTHLELSGFARPLGPPGVGLADWIRQLMATRATCDATRAVRLGLAESDRRGVVALGEIAQPGWAAEPFRDSDVWTTVFLELIGPTLARRDAALALARQHLEAWRPGCGWRAGLSPHAPYTVRRELLDAVVQLAIAHGVPLAFHLAESREELQLLGSGTGPLRAMLEELGAWEPGAILPSTRPLDYLRALAAAPRSLVIHGNYLAAEELAFLGRHAERMAVVYCPRTHAWFRHADYPLERMLATGAVVALGTDSRASSPDLSLLEEMREAAWRHPAVAPEQFLRMATLNGARALGLDAELGTLEPGKLARLTVVPLPDRAGDPYQLLLRGR